MLAHGVTGSSLSQQPVQISLNLKERGHISACWTRRGHDPKS